MDDVKQDAADDLFDDLDSQSDEQEDSEGEFLDRSTNADATNSEQSNHEGTQNSKRAEMIDNIVRKIQLGETTLQDVAVKQKWLAEAALERLSSATEQDSKLSKDEIKSLVLEEAERLLREKEKLKDFEAKKSKLSEMSLSKEKKSELNNKYQRNLALLGEGREGEALDLALEAVQIDLDEADYSRKRQDFGIFKVGDAPKRNTLENKDLYEMTGEEREAYVRNLRGY